MTVRASSFAKGFLADAATAISKTAAAPSKWGPLLLRGLQAGRRGVADMQCQGAVHSTARVPKGQGPLSFWRGSLLSLLGDIPTRALNFAFKDKHRQRSPGLVDQHAHFWRALVGKPASLCLVYPLDFARTRLEANAGKSGAQRELRGLSNCLVKTSKSDSIRGLYQGTSTSHRAPPATGCQQQLQGTTTYRARPTTGHHHLQATTVYRVSPSTGRHHLQATTVYRAPPTTGRHHLQATTVYRASPTAGRHHLQATTVYRVSPTAGRHHLQATTIYRMSPSKGRHHLQATTVYRMSPTELSTSARTTEHTPRPQEHACRGELDDWPEGESRGQRGPPPLLHHAASHGDTVGPQSH
ncbi:ADP/ATP translocase 3 [Galemys pyrenaicus]|uniref:ADP/ATP translocase n=1 Tax=Galemys pyrenaicus TaxID=202257 RepID=A0A8J5ZJE1_GALPY|nr:ADP/ATP translocase 3 [Galemys pyrenaicus]